MKALEEHCKATDTYVSGTFLANTEPALWLCPCTDEVLEPRGRKKQISCWFHKLRVFETQPIPLHTEIKFRVPNQSDSMDICLGPYPYAKIGLSRDRALSNGWNENTSTLCLARDLDPKWLSWLVNTNTPQFSRLPMHYHCVIRGSELWVFRIKDLYKKIPQFPKMSLAFGDSNEKFLSYPSLFSSLCTLAPL